MAKIKILGTGLHGLIGSQVTDLLQDQYEFANVSRSEGVDITDRQQVFTAVTQSDAAYVLHLAAKADVDGCERDKALGENGEAWRLNVLGTRHLVDACRESGKTIIYVSTDFVFNGRLQPGEAYTEQDTPSPVNWYGHTKYQAEEIVRHSGVPYLIVRPAYPYGKPYEKKKDFVQAMLGRLRNGQEIMALTDHMFTPTHIPDFASALDRLISGNVINETFHVVGSGALTPFEAAKVIADTFGFSHSLIKPVTMAEFFKDRAERPYNLSLKNDRISGLSVVMKPFSQGIHSV